MIFQYVKLEVVSLYIRYFIILGMYFDGFAINNKYIPHISLTIASAMQITETGMPGKINHLYLLFRNISLRKFFSHFYVYVDSKKAGLSETQTD